MISVNVLKLQMGFVVRAQWVLDPSIKVPDIIDIMLNFNGHEHGNGYIRCEQGLKQVCYYEYSVYAFLASDIDLKINFTFIIVRHTQQKKVFKNAWFTKKVPLELPNLNIYNEKKP